MPLPSPSMQYDSVAFSVANFIVELPWLAIIILTTMPIVYFMVRSSMRGRMGGFFLFSPPHPPSLLPTRPACRPTRTSSSSTTS